MPLSQHHSNHPEDGGSMAYEMVVSYHITTQCHNQKDHDLNLHHHKNLKSHKYTVSFVYYWARQSHNMVREA